MMTYDYFIYLYSSLRPVTTVEVAVADGFGDVHGFYFFVAGEVGGGAGYFEETAVGTGEEFQTLHGHAEHVEAGGIGLGKVVEHAFTGLHLREFSERDGL